MANGHGDYLIHPDPSQTFGFDKGRRILLQNEFPATRKLVEGKSKQTLIEAREGRYAKYPVVAAFIGQKVKVASDERRVILGLAQPLDAILAQADQLGVTTLRIVLAICLACILLAALAARAVTRPLNSMIAIVQGFSDQHQADGLPIERNDEIGSLARSFNNMQHQINQQLADLQRSRLELEHLARHDILTGLPNRALFDDRIHQALTAAQRDESKLALMFIDIDMFKPINDNLGHAVGDQLLREFASRIRRAIRDSDTAARFGGDEFIVLLRNIQDQDIALNVAEKIRLTVSQPFDFEGQSIVVTASIGIALYPEHGTDVVDLSKHADEAMYRAKEKGRNNMVLYQRPAESCQESAQVGSNTAASNAQPAEKPNAADAPAV
jgi:diguanylate cyclase (GGDEF)-like protein